MQSRHQISISILSTCEYGQCILHTAISSAPTQGGNISKILMTLSTWADIHDNIENYIAFKKFGVIVFVNK